jgi:TonB dependent receptor/TonB-dependent Receptor Plug Domain/CarboxypepD_reg-like domain
MLKSKAYFIVFIFLFFCFNGFCQEVKNEFPLKSILNKISEQHEVFFNYIEGEIVVFLIKEPNKDWTLEQKIAYIQKETKLQFNIINKVYYSISNDKKLDKPLCGYIIDAKTNLSIESVNLRIEQTNIATSTNNIGYFELPTISSNKIMISHVGYETLELNPEEIYVTNCPKIKLNPIIQELEEVNAFQYLTSGIVKKNDGTIVIKPKKIGLLPGLTEPDVFQTMQQIPGIMSVDETISNINVRGGTHDQNLFLWNGMRLFQTGHFFGLISALNPNLAHTIKITKNGSSAFYGESTSSVIDISTHSDKIENGNNSIGLNLINADFYAKIKTSKNSNFEISGRRSFTDLVNSPTYENYYNRIFQNTQVTSLTDNKTIDYKSNENFYFYDFTMQFHQKIGKNSDLFIDAITISNQLDLKQSKIENFNVIQKNSFLEQQTYGGNIQFKTIWNQKNKSEANLYSTFYKVDSENESITTNQIFNQENNVFDTGLKFNHSYEVNEKIILKSGYHYNEIGIRNFDRVNSPVFSKNIKDVLRSHALIAEINYSSENGKLKSNSGIRANYIEAFSKFIIEPRIQINYELNNNFQVDFLAEAKNQTTSQIIDLQQDFLGIEKRRWILSNEKQIPIVYNKQASLGLTYKQNDWTISIDNFYKKVTGITSQSQGFQNQLEFLRINGEYNILGSELLIQKQINKFTTWLSYSYTNSNYNFNDFSPNVFPNNFEIKNNIGFAAIYDYKNLKIALGGRWHKGKPTTNLQSNNAVFIVPDVPSIAYKNPNSDNLTDYKQLNLSASYAFIFTKKTKLQVGFSVQNILDNKNIINQNFRINTNTNIAEKVDTFSLERTLNAFVRYWF